MYKLFIKRFLDFFIALLAIIIFSPILIVTTIILAISHKSNPIFFQYRPGKNEKIFKIIKFKTMNDKKDAQGNFLADEFRLTTIGKWVRKLSIDELPQLINVIKGDMSLIGPRPLLVQYLPLYNKEQQKRHNIKPGITGWAQINGRNALSWNEKFKYDIEYVENFSFYFDFKIVIKTIKKVFISEGITKNGHATTEFFNGKN